MGYTRTVEELRENTLSTRFFELQVGENWCWAAITAPLLNEALAGIVGGSPTHRQCDIVRQTLAPGQKACHRQDLLNPTSKPSVASPVAKATPLSKVWCDPALCRITRDIDVAGDLGKQFDSRSLMIDAVTHFSPGAVLRRAPDEQRDLLQTGALSDQLEIDDVIRLIDLGRYIVLRFVGSNRMPHFIVIHGYVVSPSVKAVKFFDPANGASAGLSLRKGHGVRPLREVKARYGTLATSLLVVTILPES